MPKGRKYGGAKKGSGKSGVLINKPKNSKGSMKKKATYAKRSGGRMPK
jgi:hypothetical protein